MKASKFFYKIPPKKYAPRMSFLLQNIAMVVDGIVSIPLILFGVQMNMSMGIAEKRLVYSIKVRRAETVQYRADAVARHSNKYRVVKFNLETGDVPDCCNKLVRYVPIDTLEDPFVRAFVRAMPVSSGAIIQDLVFGPQYKLFIRTNEDFYTALEIDASDI